PELVGFLQRSAGGHPGLTAELLRSAAVSGALQETADGFSISVGKLSALGVPASFESALLGRVDGLNAGAQSLALALAVWEEAGARELAEAVAEDGAGAWNEIESSGLAAEGTQHLWSLQPPALGRVLIARLAPGEQSKLHARAADWLARHRPQAAGA